MINRILSSFSSVACIGDSFCINSLDKLSTNKLTHPLHSSSDANVPRKDIKILTYNLFLRPSGIKDDKNGDYKNERLFEFIKLLPEYDIICLEEVFDLFTSRKARLIDYAKKSGFLYIAQSPKPSLKSLCVLDGGLIILSRFPIIKLEFQAFPKGYHIDAYVEKGVLYVQIQIKSSVLHIFHSHQFADYSDYTKSMSRRAEGFFTWRKLIEEIFKTNSYEYNKDLCILLGDFNINWYDEYFSIFLMSKHPVYKQYPDLVKFNEYDAMCIVLTDNFKDDIEDLVLKKHGYHLPTFGNIYGDEYDKTFDYIFEFIPWSLINKEGQNINNRKKRQLSIIEQSVGIEKFVVNNLPFKQLSDHYGVKVSLEYDENIKTKN